MYWECRLNPATSLSRDSNVTPIISSVSWWLQFAGSVSKLLGVSFIVIIVIIVDCGILWFKFWIFSWEDSNVSKHWTPDKWNKRNRFLWRPWNSCGRYFVVAISVCVCVCTCEHVLGMLGCVCCLICLVESSLTSLIMGLNICHDLKIESNWWQGCQRYRYLFFFFCNYVVLM